MSCPPARHGIPWCMLDRSVATGWKRSVGGRQRSAALNSKLPGLRIKLQVLNDMTTRRNARVNRAIQEAVSTAVLFKLKDPRVKNVTVLRAEATEDLRQAKVYVSVMGDLKRQVLTMKGLNSARGFLQSKVAERLMTKQTPILTFVLDQTIKMDAEAQAALNRLFPAAKVADEDEQANEEDEEYQDDEDDADEDGDQPEAELQSHEELSNDE
jgi:ribosome-binding factor A